jgi:hypothetical protein
MCKKLKCPRCKRSEKEFDIGDLRFAEGDVRAFNFKCSCGLIGVLFEEEQFVADSVYEVCPYCDNTLEPKELCDCPKGEEL